MTDSEAVGQTEQQKFPKDGAQVPTKTPDSSKTKESLKQQAVDRAALSGLEGLLRFKDINEQFDESAFKDVFQISKMEAQPFGPNTKLPVAAHAKTLSTNVQKSKGFEAQFTPSDPDALKSLKSAAEDVKSTLKNVDQLMAQGSYGLAKNQLEAMLKKVYQPGNSTGEYVMTAMKGVGTDSVDATRSLMGQMGFVDKMQKAGIQAQLPPSEQQLKDYFATFKSNPSTQKTAEAKQAFRDYVDAFHIHPAKSTGNASSDVVYGADKTKTDGIDFKTANSWKEVTTDRQVDQNGKFAGKYVNDCEGYAYLGETLLGAAGFKVKGYVSGVQDDKRAHIMVLLEDPQGKPAVTSNEEVYDASNVRVEGKTVEEQRVEILEGGWSGAGAKGYPNFYIGDTSAESQSHMVHKVKDQQIKRP